jgi:type II secretory pathway component PulK
VSGPDSACRAADPREPSRAAARGRGRSREEGVVLLLVLVLVATTIGAVYAFARVSVLGVASARQRMDRLRAELLARSSLDVALQALRDDAASPQPLHKALESPEDAWAVLSRQPLVQPDEGMELQFQIRDAGQRIDLNALIDDKGVALPNSARFLRDALQRVIDALPGRREEKPYDPEALADAILDWIDADTTTRRGDDEQETYAKQGARRGPLNRPLFTLAELADVPGIDARLLEALDAYFDPSIAFPRSSGGGGVNPNTAPPHVLAMIYLVASERDTRFLEKDDVYRILKARKDGQLFCPPGSGQSERCIDFASAIGRGEQIFPPLTYQSNSFSIEIDARAREARACVFAVFDRRPPKEGGGLLSYRLGC